MPHHELLFSYRAHTLQWSLSHYTYLINFCFWFLLDKGRTTYSFLNRHWIIMHGFLMSFSFKIFCYCLGSISTRVLFSKSHSFELLLGVCLLLYIIHKICIFCVYVVSTKFMNQCRHKQANKWWANSNPLSFYREVVKVVQNVVLLFWFIKRIYQVK